MNGNMLTRAGGGILFGAAPACKAAMRCATALMALMALPVFFDVTFRYVFAESLPGANELEEFFLALVTFLALASLQISDDHIKVTFFTDRLSGESRDILNVFNWGCATPLVAVMAWRMWIAAMQKMAAGDTSFDLGIPIWPFMAIGAAGLALLFMVLLGHFLGALGRSAAHGRLAGAVAMLCAAAIVCAAPAWLPAMFPGLGPFGLGGVCMASLMAFLFMGMPIGLGMALCGSLGLMTLNPQLNAAFSMMGQASYTTAGNYNFTVIPLFVLMGELAYRSGISGDLFRAANVWLGRLPGGLGIAGVTGCAGFAAVCGDSMATAVTMGSVALPEMRKKHYDPAFGCATLAAGGTLGILIPPSMGFIFYAIVTEESIGRLFVAGIIPGVLLALIFIAIVMIIAHRSPERAPRGESYPFSEKVRSLKGVLAMLALICLILGGILGGFFSPNEGGAVGAVGAFIYAVARRRLTLKSFWQAVESTVQISGRLMLILVGVGLLGYFFAATQLPQKIAEVVGGLGTNRYIIFSAIVLIYIVLGCLMNVIPMILLTLPALFPTITALGFDPVWFGVVTVLLMEMGQITPPVGINVFAISSLARDVPMTSIFTAIGPFFLGMLLMILLLVLFPGLATWLPAVLI